MKNLKLTNSTRLVIVDDEDYQLCKQYKWCICDEVVLTTQFQSGRNTPLGSFVMQDITSMYDHKNRNSLDNRKENLRKCNYSQNAANRSKVPNTTSKYRGVAFYKSTSKWRAQIEYSNKGYHLGYFKTEIGAARAYDKKAKEIFGEFANLNFPTLPI